MCHFFFLTRLVTTPARREKKKRPREPPRERGPFLVLRSLRATLATFRLFFVRDNFFLNFFIHASRFSRVLNSRSTLGRRCWNEPPTQIYMYTHTWIYRYLHLYLYLYIYMHCSTLIYLNYFNEIKNYLVIKKERRVWKKNYSATIVRNCVDPYFVFCSFSTVRKSFDVDHDN